MNSISFLKEKELEENTSIEKVDEYTDQFEFPGPTSKVEIIRIGPDTYKRISDYGVRWEYHEVDDPVESNISDNLLRALETLYQKIFDS